MIALACLFGAASVRSAVPTLPPATPPIHSDARYPSDTLVVPGSDSTGYPADTAAGINHTRLIIVGGAMAGAMVGIHLYQESGWWEYNRAPFHFREDLTYGRSVDKSAISTGRHSGPLLRKALGWVPDHRAMYLGSRAFFPP